MSKQFKMFMSRLRIGDSFAIKVFIWWAVKVLKWPYIIMHRGQDGKEGSDLEGITFSVISPESSKWMIKK